MYTEVLSTFSVLSTTASVYDKSRRRSDRQPLWRFNRLAANDDDEVSIMIYQADSPYRITDAHVIFGLSLERWGSATSQGVCRGAVEIYLRYSRKQLFYII